MLLVFTVTCSVLTLLAARFCYRMVFYNVNEAAEEVFACPPGKQYEAVSEVLEDNIRKLQEIPFEQIYIRASDGEILAGKYYHFRDNAPVQILFHGYRGNGLREFACGNQMAREIGYNTIVVDERAHGQSGGHTISFGIKERWDCLDWANYARNRFGDETKVILSGVSMGAATVLMASELELPDTVAAITADCPYSAPGAIIRKVTDDVKLPPWLIYPFVVLGAFVFGHFCLWASSPVKAVRNTKIPILLIHGEEDYFVPCAMSREIHKACKGPAVLVTFPKAGHGLSYLTDTTRYHSIYRDFFQTCKITT